MVAAWFDGLLTPVMPGERFGSLAMSRDLRTRSPMSTVRHIAVTFGGVLYGR
jgi:hypothetical protein